MEQYYAWRAQKLATVYQYLLKPLFFRLDPELVHDRMVAAGNLLGRFAVTRWLTHLAFNYQNPKLTQTVAGIHFANPIGLAAGFDKNAQLTQILPSVGFGFVEVGSVTGQPCSGNSGKRLWRLPKSQALVVYYGLKNDGAAVIAQRLAKTHFAFPVGFSVAKTNSPETVPVEAGVADYAAAMRATEPLASYITVNISCPNAFGGEPFTNPERLEKLLTELDVIPTQKPVFVKFSPDLDFVLVDQLLTVLDRHRVSGVICTNLTKKRDRALVKDATVPNVGGISGKVVQEQSDALILHIYKARGRKYVIIGCGGVFTAEDAYRKIRLGASLIQLITGMIYQGPQTIGYINQGLVKLLERDGFANIAEAIGIDA
jgi:dihydroorotate dehydrogenase subfamily 2